jgi:uncharacterized protein involved in response to NO
MAELPRGRASGLSARLLFDEGFRVFFLLCGSYGSALLLVWIAVLADWMLAPSWLMPVWWHAHEMIFGFVLAAVAGFLLTSVPAWTGTRPVSGVPLLALAALWVAGRVAMALAGQLPLWSVAVVDCLFIPGLVLAITPAILAAGRARNYGFPLILGGLLACNVAVHVQATSPAFQGADAALRFAVNLVVVLIAVVGGRIVPAFTANALRRVGSTAEVRVRPRLGQLAIAALLLFAALDLLAHAKPWTGASGVLASLLLLLRMSGWQTPRTLRDPLLWSLHLGYAWLPLGLLLLGLAPFGVGISRSVGIHALTAGAIGSMVLAVMSRVGLGHTGRPLVAPRAIAVAYLSVAAGALLRVVGPTLWPEASVPILRAAGVLWSGSFAVFTVVYAPILLSPRKDD